MPQDWRILPEFVADDCKAIPLASSRQGAAPYCVDLTTYTCTCPDHQARRRGFPARDLRRACKHIEQALRDRGIALDETAQAIMDSDPRGVPPFTRCLETTAANAPAIILQTEGNEWLDVFARKGKTGAVRRFGFSLAEHRWARGDSPADQQQIREVIAGWMGVKIGKRRREAQDEKEDRKTSIGTRRMQSHGLARGLLFAGAIALLLALIWFLSH